MPEKNRYAYAEEWSYTPALHVKINLVDQRRKCKKLNL